jgi:hypothetical protein
MIGKVFIPITNDNVFGHEDFDSHWVSYECNQWLKSLKKGSVHLIWLHEEKCVGCSFHFDNKSDAVLFKLMWV